MCAVHAQLMSSVELALWARVAGLDRRAVQRALWEERTLAKTWCMRGTLHVMRADDLPLYQAARGVGRYRSAAWLRYFDLAPSDIDRIADAVGTALDGRMLTRKELADEVARLSGRELRQRLLSGWGALLKPAAYLGRLCFGPPQGQEVTFVRPDQWLGRWTAWTEEGARQEVLRRYLRTYGPATRDDFEWWLGIPPREAKPPWAAVEPELAAVEVDGRPAWVLAGTRLPTGGPRLGVRLLPGFDGYVLGHRTRSHLVDEAFRGRVYRPQGWVSPTVLVNGRIEGVWSHRRWRRSWVESSIFS